MCVMIMGSGFTGLAVADFLERKNIEYFFISNEDINAEYLDEKYLDDLLYNVSYVIVSPGISLNKYIIIQIKKRKIALFGEFDFAASRIMNDIISVTGTNGKTTTVTLIHYLLKNFSSRSRLP